MKSTTKLALAIGTALALGLTVAEVNAHPNGMGWGAGSGMGFGMHGAGMGAGMNGYGMGPGMHGCAMGPGMHGKGMGPQANSSAGTGTTEERLAGLKTELGITTEQDGAWQAFVKSAKQQEEGRQARFARMHEARTAESLPEFRAKQDELIKERQAVRESATAALKDLYAALTPQQKAIADRGLAGVGPGAMAGHGQGRFGGHHGNFR
ncbi:MAG: Spy/CpxP family protein refolding chaperone [Betaproteobacteria bacterium]|nr:Spy/CpxP family protein refolding chaperone [Betaproteobacteria bacterium]